MNVIFNINAGRGELKFNKKNEYEFWHIRIDWAEADWLDNTIEPDDHERLRTIEYIDTVLKKTSLVLHAYYQGECSKSRYHHLHVAIALSKPLNWFAICNMFRIEQHEYARPATNWPATIQYCQKEHTRIDGPYQYHRGHTESKLSKMIRFT